MAPVVAHSVRWDIYDDHLSEAAWLWGEWEGSLDSAVYALDDVIVGPEERLLAHLDGLVLGGAAVAEKLLLPALASDDRGQVAAAAWVLVQAEHGDRQDAVVASLAVAEPPARAAIARALSLCPRADLSRLVPLWNTGSAPVRAIVLEAFGPREPDWLRERLGPALSSGEPSLCAAGLRAVRNFADRNFLGQVQDALQSNDPTVRQEAVTAGIRLGSKEAWGACRRAASDPEKTGRVLLGLLATSADPNDRNFVRGLAHVPALTKDVLWALGFAGDLESAEALVGALGDEETAKIAGDSLSAITGLAIAGHLARKGEPGGPGGAEVADDDPPPVVRSEDFLPLPDGKAVENWWSKERSRFRSGMRYLQGQPRDSRTLLAALTTTSTWRRGVLWLELGNVVAHPPALDLRTWAREQRRQLER